MKLGLVNLRHWLTHEKYLIIGLIYMYIIVFLRVGVEALYCTVPTRRIWLIRGHDLKLESPLVVAHKISDERVHVNVPLQDIFLQ